MDELTTVAFVILILYLFLGYKKPGFAFATVPLATLILLYASVVTEAPEGLVLAPLLFVGTLIAVAASGRDRESRQWFHWWAWRLLIAIALVLLLGITLVWFSALGAGFVLPLFFIFGIVIVLASPIIYGLAFRRRTVMTVFSTIGSIMRQNLPLAMALDCAATGHEDAATFILRGIRTWLVKGHSLTEAVRRGYPQCPARVLAMLSAGERIGQLPAALRAIETDLKASVTERKRLQPVHPFYPVAVLIFALPLLLGIVTFVIPQFSAILKEMTGGRLPTSTRILLGIMQSFLHGGAGIALGFLGLVVSILPGVSLIRLLRRRRPEKPYVLSWIVDSVKWFLPMVHWFEKNRSMAQVVELLRMSLDAGCPVNEAIRGTLQLDVNVCFRTRLASWLRRVERGEDIAKSARRCGLGSALAWAFDGGADTGNTPAVLEMLESYYRSNYSYRVNLARFILWPLVIVALGATVGFIVYAVFSPMVAVLTSLSGSIYP
jgi:type IV pilus assembly protein PilC